MFSPFFLEHLVFLPHLVVLEYLGQLSLRRGELLTSNL